MSTRKLKEPTPHSIAADLLTVEAGRTRAKGRALYQKSLTAKDAAGMDHYTKARELEEEIARRLDVLAGELRKTR